MNNELKEVYYEETEGKRINKSIVSKPNWNTENRAGELYEFNYNKPVKWQDFKKLSTDLQIIYLNHIRHTFSIGRETIAKAMGTTVGSLAWYLSTKLNFKWGRVNETEEALKEFFGWWEGTAENTSSSVEETSTPPIEVTEDFSNAQDTSTPAVLKNSPVNALHLSLIGGADAAKAIASMYSLFENSEYTISISVSKQQS